MNKILVKIRNKPSHIKEQIAVIGALALTGVIGLFWVSSLSGSLKSVASENSLSKSLSPFMVLKDNLNAAAIRTESSLQSIVNINSEDNIDSGETPVTVNENGVVIFGEN